MQFESLVTMGTLITLAGAFLRLAFQSGTTVNTLKAVGEKVDQIAAWAENARVQNAQLLLRVESLERRLDRLEARG